MNTVAGRQEDISKKIFILRSKFQQFLVAAKKQQYDKQSLSRKLNITSSTLVCTLRCDTYVQYCSNE